MRHPFPIRHNADFDLRSVERAAASGDPQAREALWAWLRRTGRATLEWLADPGNTVAIQDLMPRDLREAILKNVLLASMTDHQSSRSYGGWFPGHRRMDVCPRGHGVDQGFTANEVVGAWAAGREVDGEGSLVVSVEVDHSDSSVTDLRWVDCTDCGAAWPAWSVVTGE